MTEVTDADREAAKRCINRSLYRIWPADAERNIAETIAAAREASAAALTAENRKLRAYHSAVESMVCVWKGTNNPSSFDEEAWEQPADQWAAFCAARAALTTTAALNPISGGEAEKHGWKCNNCQTVFTHAQTERKEGDPNGGPDCPYCKAHGQYTYRYKLHQGDPCTGCGIAHDDVPQGPCVTPHPSGDAVREALEKARSFTAFEDSPSIKLEFSSMDQLDAFIAACLEAQATAQ